MTLKKKLSVSFLLASLVPLLAGSLLLRQTLSDTLHVQIEHEIDLLKTNKAKEVAQFFEVQADAMLVMASNPTMSGTLDRIARAFYSSSTEVSAERLAGMRAGLQGYYRSTLGEAFAARGASDVDTGALQPAGTPATILQSLYIAENTHPLGDKYKLLSSKDKLSYDRVHAEVHPYFQHFVESHGLYDLFLIERREGNIVYSVFKETDYATSLDTGPYSQSGLARVYHAALQLAPGEWVVDDFNPYVPSYNDQAVFVATPVMDGDTVKGAIAIQMPVDKLTAITMNGVDTSKGWKAFVVGDDQVIRTDLPGDDGSAARTSEAAKHGVAFEETVDYAGETVYSGVQPFSIKNLNWHLVVQQNKTTALATLGVIDTLIATLATIAVALAVGVAWIITRSTLKTLGAEPAVLNQITAEIARGDLSRDFDERDSHTGTLSMMVDMQQQLRARAERDAESLRKIRRMSDGLSKLSTPVMLADDQGQVSFANNAMAHYVEAYRNDLQSLIPSLRADALTQHNLAEFSADDKAAAQTLAGLRQEWLYEIQAGSRLIDVTVNPIRDDGGELVGYSMELNDVTVDRQIIMEVNGVIEAASHGNLRGRMNTHDKHGTNLELSEGINTLLTVTERVITDVSLFLSMMADGDLRAKISTPYEGAFATVKDDANRAVERLRSVVDGIRESAYAVSQAASELNSGNLDLSSRTEKSTASLEESSSNIDELTTSVSNNAQHARKASDVANTATDNARRGGDIVERAVVAMASINESSGKIADIITVIDEIAFQTNLLALNASVEAARAGEQGRGFSVVAEEVRNLAQRSASAAREIKDLIRDSLNRVENGSTLVNQSGEVLVEIVQSITDVATIVSAISDATNEQSNGISAVNATISQLDQATQRNASLVEEASMASQSCSAEADTLLELIAFFKQQGSDAEYTDRAA